MEVQVIAAGKVATRNCRSPADSQSVKQRPDISRHDDMVLD